MTETTTKLIFRAGREAVAFDENALRTAEQAKRRAAKRGQGRLQHHASMLVTAIKASYKTTALMEMMKQVLAEMLEDIGRVQPCDELCGLLSRIEVMLDCLRAGELPEPPKPLGFWAQVWRFFFRRGK